MFVLLFLLLQGAGTCGWGVGVLTLVLVDNCLTGKQFYRLVSEDAEANGPWAEESSKDQRQRREMGRGKVRHENVVMETKGRVPLCTLLRHRILRNLTFCNEGLQLAKAWDWGRRVVPRIDLTWEKSSSTKKKKKEEKQGFRGIWKGKRGWLVSVRKRQGCAAVTSNQQISVTWDTSTPYEQVVLLCTTLTLGLGMKE